MRRYLLDAPAREVSAFLVAWGVCVAMVAAGYWLGRRDVRR